MIDPRLRDRIRLAKAIQRCLPRPRDAELSSPLGEWLSFQRAIERLQLVRSRGWVIAATRLTSEDLRQTADHLNRQITAVALAGLRHGTEPAPQATLADIVQDLTALEQEFPRVYWDLKGRTLSVVTEDIELEGIGLGPFEIHLELRRLSSVRPYDVLALEPNPAAGDGATPHPHVRNDDLCEGEGKTAIQSALRQGRILDFFVLIRQVLETYNADSAYVPLGRWLGTRCPDCAVIVADDDLSYCEACDSDVCGDCSTSCQGSRCGRSLCSECADRCGDCEETHCSRCLTACAGCENDYCADCLTQDRSSDCQEIPDADDETPTTESEEAPQTSAAVHAVGMGQAPVPPGHG